MSQSFNNRYSSMSLLLGVLIFTLSSLPKVSNAGKVEHLDLSSDCNLQIQLGEKPEGGCTLAVRSTLDGRTVKGAVKAKVVTNIPPKRYGHETDTVVPEEGVELETDTETECAVCATGSRKGQAMKLFVKKSEADKLDQFAKELFEKAAATLAEETRKDSQKTALIESCEINEQGQTIAEQDRLPCQITRFQNMDEAKRAEYYQKYIKGQLKDVLGGTDPEQRKWGQQLLPLLQQTSASVSVRASLLELQKFGEAHSIADQLIANPNITNKQELLGKWQAAQRYFQLRGMSLNSVYSKVMDQVETAVLAEDIKQYQADLANVSSAHTDWLKGTSTQPLPAVNTPLATNPYAVQFPNRPSNGFTKAVPTGNGRAEHGTVTTSYQQVSPMPPKPGAQPARPGVPATQQPARPGVPPGQNLQTQSLPPCRPGQTPGAANGIPVVGALVNCR